MRLMYSRLRTVCRRRMGPTCWVRTGWWTWPTTGSSLLRQSLKRWTISFNSTSCSDKAKPLLPLPPSYRSEAGKVMYSQASVDPQREGCLVWGGSEGGVWSEGWVDVWSGGWVSGLVWRVGGCLVGVGGGGSGYSRGRYASYGNAFSFRVCVKFSSFHFFRKSHFHFCPEIQMASQAINDSYNVRVIILTHDVAPLPADVILIVASVRVHQYPLHLSFAFMPNNSTTTAKQEACGKHQICPTVFVRWCESWGKLKDESIANLAVPTIVISTESLNLKTFTWTGTIRQSNYVDILPCFNAEFFSLIGSFKIFRRNFASVKWIWFLRLEWIRGFSAGDNL